MEIRTLEPSAQRPRASAPFLPYIHAFRAVAIVSVVGSHFSGNWTRVGFFARAELSLVRNASVLFLFVAGFLFQYLSRGFSYGRYLKTKLSNVIVPYVVISLPELLRQYLRHAGVFASVASRHFPNALLHAGWTLIIADHMAVPLWFVPMIAILYLAAPLLLAVDRRPAFYAVLIPLIAVGMLCHRPLPVNQIGQAVLYFTPAYIAGMWFSRHRARFMSFIDDHLVALWLLWAGIELLDLLVLGRAGPIFSRAPFSTENGVVDLSLPSRILLSFCLVGLLARRRAPFPRWVDVLAGASFGVFFVHGYIVRLAESESVRWLHREFSPTPESLVLLVPLVTLLSVGIVALVRAVAGKRSRYIVGC